MFKKILSFFKGEDVKTASAETTGSRSAPKRKTATPAATKPGNPAPPKPKKQTPEALCEINPKTMSAAQIKERLAMLYKRHNQAAASLNDDLRAEAEEMLDAVVTCRQKYVDKPEPKQKSAPKKKIAKKR